MDTGNDEENCMSPEVVLVEKSETENLFPTKSEKAYETTYRTFMEWCDRKNTYSFSENVLLDYFGDLAEKYKSSSLWTQYSMLRSTLETHHNVKLESYAKLRALLKSKSDGYKAKKAKAFTSQEVNTFIKNANDLKYLATKVALIMGIMGACRCNEMKEMKMEDLQDLTSAMLVNVPNTTNTRVPRRFTITGDFYQIVKKYIALRPANVACTSLFLNYSNGRCSSQEMNINKFTAMGKQIATYLKLPNADMYSGHSFRRSSATLRAESMKNKMDTAQQIFQSTATMDITASALNLSNCKNFTIHIHTDKNVVP